MWTELERNRNTLKQSLNITSRHQNNVPTKHVNIRTTPLREYRLLFAEFSSQGGRSTPTSLQSPFPSPHATFLVLAARFFVSPSAPTLATTVTEPAVLTTPVVVFPNRFEQHQSTFVPGLQRSHLAKRSQGRLQACSYSSPSPPFPEPSCRDCSDSLSCHSEPR